MRRRLAALALLILAVVAALYLTRPGGDQPRGSTVPPAQGTDRSAVRPATGATGPPAGDRVAVAPGEGVPAAPMALAVRGRCVRGVGGPPLAGCVAELRFEDDARPATRPWGEGDGQVVAVTAADGTFELRLPAGARAGCALRVSAEGCAPRFRRWRAPPAEPLIEVGDVPMTAAIAVRGVVVDRDGAPVAGVGVLFAMIDPTARPDAVVPEDLLRARSDDAGRFAFGTPAFPGEWYVGAEDTGPLVGPRSVRLTGEDADHDLRIVVERPDPSVAIHGTVADGAGDPLADVRLSATGEGFTGRGRSGVDGRFVVHRAGPVFDDGRPGASLSAVLAGHEQVEPAAGERVAWGQRDVRVVLRRRVAMSVRVLDARGRPVTDYALFAFRAAGGRLARDAALTRRGHHAGGRCELTDLRAGDHAVLIAPVREGLAPAELVRFTPAAGQELVVTVRDAVPARVVVTGRGGAPVEGSAVELLLSLGAEPPAAADAAVPVGEADRGRTTPELLRVAAATTGADGAARLAAPPGSWHLRVAGAEHVTVVRAVEVAPGGAPIRVEVDAAAVVCGTLGPRAAVARLRELAANAEEPVAVVVAPVGGGAAVAAAVDDGGAFVAGGLRGGDHAVSLRYWLRTGAVREGSVVVPLASVHLVEGERRDLPLDVAAALPGRLAGRVTVDGEPLRETHCFLRRLGPGDATSLRVATDAGGAFEGLVPPGRYGFAITMPAQPGPGWIYLAPDGEWPLAAGADEALAIEVALRRMRVRVLGADGAPLAGQRVKLVCEGFFLPGGLATDDGGWLALDPAPPRAFRLRLELDGEAVELGPIDLPAGARRGDVVVRVGR